MKKNTIKESSIIWIVIAISIILIFLGNRIAMGKTSFFDEKSNLITAKATVTKIINKDTKNDLITFKCDIMEGKHSGQTVTAAQMLDQNMGSQVRMVKEGDKIFLGDATSYDIGTKWFMYDFNRLGEMKSLAIAFAVLLLLFGRSKGFRTIISLILTCSTIFFVFIPAVLSGLNIYVCSIITCLFITFMTLLVVQGPNTKSLAAALGCCGGMLVVSGLTITMSEVLRLTGLLNEDSLYLLYLDQKDPIHLKAIIFASITIGAMGAILDIAVDISASLREVHQHAQKTSIHQTIRSGITIGQDIVGSMSNTLILAYIGSSLSVILLLLIHSGSLQDLMNSEQITVEILQSLAGSIGILFTIPLTAISCGILYNRSNKGEESISSEIEEKTV